MGIGSSARKVLPLNEESENHSQFPKVKVVLVGNRGVGKSSLVSRLIQNSFPDEHVPTYNVDIKVKTFPISVEKVASLEIWDIPGEFSQNFDKTYFRLCDGVILMIDSTNRETVESKNIQFWMDRVRTATNDTMSTSIDEHGIPVYLFANKVEDAFAQQVHSHELSSISLYLGISGVHEVSVLRDFNVYRSCKMVLLDLLNIRSGKFGDIRERQHRVKKLLSSSMRRYAIFGIDLEYLPMTRSAEGFTVPIFIDEVVKYLGRDDVFSTSGLFVESSSLKDITEWRAVIETGGPSMIQKCSNPHTVANLLKVFLRELPSPIIPISFVEDACSLMRIKLDSRLRIMCESLFSLPEINLSVFRPLCRLLHRISYLSQSNGLDSKRVAGSLSTSVSRPSYHRIFEFQQLFAEIIDNERMIFSLLDNMYPRLSVRAISIRMCEKSLT